MTGCFGWARDLFCLMDLHDHEIVEERDICRHCWAFIRWSGWRWVSDE